MKKIGLYAIALCCIMLMVYLGYPKEDTANSNEIRIGAIIPLTGYAALTGEMFTKGLNMAEEEINANNTKLFDISIEDCKSVAKDAISSYRKMESNGITIFIGFGGQFILSYASNTNNKDKVLLVSGAANANLLDLSNRCLRFFPTADMVTDMVQKYVVEKQYSKVAIVSMQNEAYSMYARAAKDKILKVGKEVVFEESYDPGCREFKEIVNKLSSQDVDIIYSAGLGESSALLTKQLFENPKTRTIPIIGDMNFSDSKNLDIIGEVKAPISVIDSYVDDEFIRKFESKYNMKPNAYSVYGYIIPFVIKETIEKLGNDATAIDIYNYIRTHNFETIAGNISFDKESGEPKMELIINTIMPKTNKYE